MTRAALPDTLFELVIQGAAVSELTTASVLATSITVASAEHGIGVRACANSLRAVGVAAKDLAEGVGSVPATVAYLAQRQWDGWAYVRV